MSSGELLPPTVQHELLTSSHGMPCLHGRLLDSGTSTSAGVAASPQHACLCAARCLLACMGTAMHACLTRAPATGL